MWKLLICVADRGRLARCVDICEEYVEHYLRLCDGALGTERGDGECLCKSQRGP